MMTLHTSQHYTAHLTSCARLIIESTRKAGGVMLRIDHPQFAEYIDAFRTAIDIDEADALCRALVLNNPHAKYSKRIPYTSTLTQSTWSKQCHFDHLQSTR